MAVAKQRGVKLGRTGSEILAPKYRAEAKVRAEKLAPMLRDLQAKDYSLRQMADALTIADVETPNGGTWHPMSVQRVLQRLDVAAA